MRPALPPGLVSLLCAVPRAKQGFPDRTLSRLVTKPWGKWRVDVAEKWCEVCGFDFWKLDAARNLSALRRIDWQHKTKRVRQALIEMLQAAGVRKPTLAQQDALAEAFRKTAG